MAYKKLIVCAVASALALFAFTACGSTGGVGQDGGDDLQTIVVGSDTYPPFVSNDENGVASGIDVDIATEAFKRIGYRPEFKYIPWEKKAELLDEGQIDCIMSCFSMTGRESEYKWAGPYMKSRQVVAVDPVSPIQTLSDLEGKTVAVQSTTKPEAILLDQTNPAVPEIGTLYSFSDRSNLVPALSKGYVDAVAAHETSLLQYEQDYGVRLRILDESLLDVGLGCAFGLNDDRGIDQRLSQAFQDMIDDGTMGAILSRYFDDPAPFLEVGDLYE